MCVATYARVFAKSWTAPKAWEFVAGLLASPGYSVLESAPRHRDVAAEVIAETPHLSGDILHHAHTAMLMREHGVKTIMTNDLGFHRFRFLEVVELGDFTGRFAH